MRSFLILILTFLALAGLAACSGNDQQDEGAGSETAVAHEPAPSAEPPAEKAPALIPESGVQTADAQHLEACRSATQELGLALKSALQEAMGQGGPVNAVNVCHDEAEAIAQRICDEEGLVVGRTSEKCRNPDNAPDAWEKAGLEAFAARMTAGEKPQDLEMWATVTETDGSRTFRYLKAIPTGPVCLKCHGAELDTDLAEKLTELYPGDEATGYAVGDLRGAFTVKVELPRS